MYLLKHRRKAFSGGIELVDTPPYTGAAQWVAYVNNIVSQDGDYVKTEYVDSINGSYIVLNTGSIGNNFVIGASYRLTLIAKVNTGSVNFNMAFATANPANSTVTSTSDVEVVIDSVATAVTTYLKTVAMGSGEIIWLKNLSIKAT